MSDLEKLNRLRVNAGKTELKSWKGSKKVLLESIAKLEADGHTDVLPGANTEAKPITTDPVIQAARPDDDPPSLSESAMSKNVDKSSEKPEPKKTNGKASLARGLDTDGYARHSRERVQDIRRKEREEEAAKKKKPEKVKLSKEDKKQIREEAESRKPSKEERQKAHIEEKRAKRAAEGKLKPAKEKNADEISVADIARELDIDPKVARAKLRRHEDKLEKLRGKGMDRWTFPKSAGTEIKTILRGAK